MALILITGPARSGKSEWAEYLAEQIAERNQQQVVYIATALAIEADEAWQARIEKHRQRRPTHWQCKEVPIDLSKVIAQAAEGDCLLIDSLGTWLANLIDQTQEDWDTSQAQLLSVLDKASADIVIVAEETGWGVVPAYKLGRRFRDRLGTLSRKIGAIATDVYLATGGYAINISQLGTLIPARER